MRIIYDPRYANVFVFVEEDGGVAVYSAAAAAAARLASLNHRDGRAVFTPRSKRVKDVVVVCKAPDMETMGLLVFPAVGVLTPSNSFCKGLVVAKNAPNPVGFFPVSDEALLPLLPLAGFAAPPTVLHLTAREALDPLPALAVTALLRAIGVGSDVKDYDTLPADARSLVDALGEVDVDALKALAGAAWTQVKGMELPVQGRLPGLGGVKATLPPGSNLARLQARPPIYAYLYVHPAAWYRSNGAEVANAYLYPILVAVHGRAAPQAAVEKRLRDALAYVAAVAAAAYTRPEAWARISGLALREEPA